MNTKTMRELVEGDCVLLRAYDSVTRSTTSELTIVVGVGYNQVQMYNVGTRVIHVWDYHMDMGDSYLILDESVAELVSRFAS
jgi:hypothetical protein